MKHVFLMILFCGLLLSGAMPANAGVYTFSPVPADLNDLDHYKAYEWGLAWTHAGEEIVAASLTFKDIYDWQVEPNDSLYVHLLDDPSRMGVTVYTDNQGGADFFAGDGPWIGTWTDLAGGSPTGFNLTYNFNAALLSAMSTFVADGDFGFGIDPDCHYYNRGVELSVTTRETPSIPEPTTMILLGLGLTGLGIMRRR
jgi:hypothetical protein